MSTRQYITDAATRHQVFLQRFAGGEAKKAMIALDRIRRDIKARILQEPTDFQRNRLERVLTDIDSIYTTKYTSLSQSVKRGTLDHAKSEAGFSQKLFNKATTADFALPAEAALIAAVEIAPMAAPVGSRMTSIDEALAQYGKKKLTQIKQIVTDGVVLGDTTQVIANKVGQQMVTLQRRQLDTLVRTITNHTSSVARAELYKQNSTILDGYQWVSTLDGRTTLVCAGRDGKIYQSGMGPLPPVHWGCRSTTIPKVNDAFNLGAKVNGERASVDGPVSANITYGGWLKKQPIEFQDEALGVERARLFRAGKLPIDKFTDPTGRVYTLQELERMNPFVFAE